MRVVQEFKNKAYRKNEWGGLWYLDEIPQFGMLSTAEYRIAWWAGNYEKKANKIRGLWDKHGKANLDEITILWEKFWKHQLPVAFRASQVESDLQEVVDKAYDDIKKKIDDQKDRNVMAIQVAGV